MHLRIYDPFFSKTVHHGPKTWPWWRLVSFSWVKLVTGREEVASRRLWVYFRWNVHLSGYVTRLSPFTCTAFALDFTVMR